MTMSASTVPEEVPAELPFGRWVLLLAAVGPDLADPRTSRPVQGAAVDNRKCIQQPGWSSSAGLSLNGPSTSLWPWQPCNQHVHTAAEPNPLDYLLERSCAAEGVQHRCA